MTDKLAHVKSFYYALALDGFGIRRHMDMDRLGDDVRFLHNRVLPSLFDAIRADDPDYDPQAFHVEGKAGSEAHQTSAVRWFVELLEAHKAFEAMIDRHSDLYMRMYKPGQTGHFLGELTDALRKDDPEWRGPFVAPAGPQPASEESLREHEEWLKTQNPVEPEPEPKPELDYDPDDVPEYK